MKGKSRVVVLENGMDNDSAAPNEEWGSIDGSDTSSSMVTFKKSKLSRRLRFKNGRFKLPFRLSCPSSHHDEREGYRYVDCFFTTRSSVLNGF